MNDTPSIPRVRAVARALHGFASVHDVAGEASVAFYCPDRGEWALGFGVAAEWGAQVEWDGASFDPPGPWFGGVAFDAARPWGGFPAERWVLPAVLVWARAGQLYVAAFGAALPELQQRERRSPPTLLTVQQQRPAFAALVGDAVTAIRDGLVEKVVCARPIEVEAQSPIEPRQVLERLAELFPNCCCYLLKGTDGTSFVGASPETLCDIEGAALTTEALAGSCPPGQESALLASAKDRREHSLVVQGIREALASLASRFQAAEVPTVRSLSYISHLHTPITATLHADVTPMEAARALHPTPAVCGAPRAASLQWLEAHEGFARGWYAGAVGMRGPARLRLSVGLRCALLDGRRATLFVGAGVVEGSTPEGELLETDRKARPLLEALGASMTGASA